MRYCNENNDLKVFFRWNKNQITILVYSLLGIHIYTKPTVWCIAMHINILYHTRGSELVSMLWIIIKLFIFLHNLRWCSLRVHRYGLPPVCILLCSIRLHFSEKALSHWVHWYDLSPMCVQRSKFRLLVYEKDLSKWVHWYGLSPVCVLRSKFKLLVYGKDLSHWVHSYGLSPMYVLKCT